MKSLNDGKNVIHPNVIYFKKEDAANRLIVEVAMQYSDGYNETVLTFANNINNHDGGTHLSGFRTALTGTGCIRKTSTAAHSRAVTMRTVSAAARTSSKLPTRHRIRYRGVTKPRITWATMARQTTRRRRVQVSEGKLRP